MADFPSGLSNPVGSSVIKRVDAIVNDNTILDAHISAAALKPSAAAEGNLAMYGSDKQTLDSDYPATWLPLPPHMYVGRELPFSWEQIKAKAAAGDFTGIRVGDYKTISLSTNEVVICEVAGLDTYYQYGDTAVGHHIDFISRDCLAATYAYNATATNSGGFVGSALKTTLNGTIYNTLPSDLKALIIEKRGIVETKTAATASGWSWQNIGKLWLPSEREVCGQDIWSEHTFGAGLAVQYPIFKDSLRHIVKGAGNGGARADWWLLSSLAGSASYFCLVAGRGFPTNGSAATAARVPLCFRIA
ncbi:DUF6273 domain-containing protein [Eubacteriales bacterium OttesenSCG-928-A19]|nr:DUF6273 domain-containing protein [Eubacteriales bacterium OttesenSCG-928-A19]